MMHSFTYTFKRLVRQKTQFFWNLLFPVLLGTMFYVAFSGLASDESFDPIPVAVVLESENAKNSFRDTIDTLSNPGDDQFLNASYTTEKEALSLLEQKKIIGILYEGSPVHLSISSEMTTLKLEQSILNVFVEQYNMSYSAIEEIAEKHPEKLQDALNRLTSDTSYIAETSYSTGTMDEKLNYFFNLIAMTCLFSYAGGLTVAIDNQANLSSLAVRKSISPVHKLISLLGELCATFTYHFFCILISLFYLIFILKIDFGSEGGYITLAALAGCIAGVGLGFFVGCIGKMKEGTKYGILMAVSMICCFLSGLMVGNMRILVDQTCPWFNRINPAALIADSFYSLTVYQSHQRYFTNIGTLLILSALFYFGGVLMVRREKYAAL